MPRLATNLQTKMLAILSLLCLIPLIVLGFIAYYVSIGAMERKINEDFAVFAQQFNGAVEKELVDFDRFSSSPYFVPQVLDIFQKPYVPIDSWGMQQIRDQEAITKLLLSYPFMNKSIAGLAIYGMNGSIYGFSSLSGTSINYNYTPYEENWYKKTIARQGGLVISGVREEKQFFGQAFPVITVSRALLDVKYRPTAVVAIDIAPNFIEKLVRSQPFQNVEVIVVDDEGQLIYATNPQIYEGLKASEAKPQPADASPKSRVSVHYRDRATGKTWLGIKGRSDYSNWSTTFLIDQVNLYADSNRIRQLTAAIIVVLLAAIAIISWLFTRSLTEPIRRLIRSMRKVEQGEFVVLEPAAREDEIGKLNQSYSRMVKRLQELVQAIEEKERQKQVAEVIALRARINPHFLYNTLNSIRMLAMIQGSAHLSTLIQSLSKLLQANMKLEKELVPLADEIDILKQYVLLMELRYTNQFAVDWRIPPSLERATVPSMLLQPLVENAIFHSIGDGDRKLRIGISAYVEDGSGDLLLVVEDNGSGMEPAQLQEIRRRLDDAGQREQSIGITNVHERIWLRFGKPYGLSIDSSPQRGTRITIRLPNKWGEERSTHVELVGR